MKLVVCITTTLAFGLLLCLYAQALNTVKHRYHQPERYKKWFERSKHE